MPDDAIQFLTQEPSDGADETSERAPVVNMAIHLSPVIIAIREGEPVVLVRPGGKSETAARTSLPFGPIETLGKEPIEQSVRRWAQTTFSLALGHIEQLSVFNDCNPRTGRRAARASLSIGLLALARSSEKPLPRGYAWRSWYDFMPCEDWRRGRPAVLDRQVIPALQKWVASGASEPTEGGLELGERVSITFATGGQRWNEDMVLERLEVLADAGMIEGGGVAADSTANDADGALGEAMKCGHRRVLAAAIGRLRSHLRERPMAFELMDEQFTLLDLQRTVEAMLGPHLHKQNFRRLVETAKLVEPTGEINAHTGGRPAKLFRFRRQALLESTMLGLRARSRG